MLRNYGATSRKSFWLLSTLGRSWQVCPVSAFYDILQLCSLVDVINRFERQLDVKINMAPLPGRTSGHVDFRSLVG
jgi:hypothetical protein